MTPQPLTSPAVGSERGISVIELMVAVVIMMTVTGSVFQLMNPSQGTFQAQPEVSDMQQRLRVGVDALYKDIVMAGAGTYAGSSAGALTNFFAPIMPYRAGGAADDPSQGVYFRPDAISLVYVPPTPAQTTISAEMPPQSSELKVNPQANCPGNKQNQLCGFEVGMRLIIFDESGSWDPFTVTQVQDAAAHIQHRDDNLTVKYAAGAFVTQVKTATYYLKTDIATNTFQLMYWDGYKTDLPVVDNVVKLEFEYFGDPQPPQLLPNKALTDPKGPYTTYGPKPPALGVDNASDNWGAGENCVFAVQNGAHVPRLQTMAAGVGQVQLTQNMLTDGPWCADNTRPNRYDADLLRVRRVRIKLRVQAAHASLRGPAGPLFIRGGNSSSAERFVPDQELRFDVTPRNLNLGR